MGRASRKFDQGLFALKLSELSREMKIKSEASFKKRSAGSRGTSRSVLMNIVDCQLALLRDEWLRGVDRIAREVWQTQREVVTPDFVRDVLVPKAMTLIGVRDGVIKTSVERAHLQTRLENPYPAQHHLAMEISRLKGEVANRYEIEARELGYRNAPMERAQPEKPPKPTQATWRSCGDEFKQLADEETRIIRATKKERLLADCDFDSSATFEQTTRFELRRGPDEHLRVRFEALATKAGIAIGCANNGAPLKFWLFKLFLYLSENKSHHLFAPTSNVRIGDDPQSDLLKPHAGENLSRAGGIITNVYEASANFCFWLEKQALEAEHRRGSVDLKSQNEQPTPPGLWMALGGSPYLHKLIACLAVEQADLWSEYGEAAPFVKQLAEIEWNTKIQWKSRDATESPRLRAELIERIFNDYPEAAKKLALPSLEASESSASTAEGRSKNAAPDPPPKDEKVEQDSAESEFADVLASSIGGRRGGLDLKRSLFAERESWIRRSVPKRGNRGGRRKAVKGKPEDHRAMVEAYIEEGRKKGKRITKKDIWTAAGYRTRTEFERWERQDPKRPNKAADKNFTRVLREKPHLD